MKTRFLTGLFVVSIAFQALAQRVENDDMYFRKKDREKVKNQEAVDQTDSYAVFKKKNKIKDLDEPAAVNPTDSYSSENINPEYISRANSETATEEEYYFTESYSPNSYGSQNFSSYNSPYGSTWNSSIGFNNAWLASPYTWNDPFYYSPYGYNPWMSNPYTGGYGYGSGWSLSMSYYWGNSWGSGWNYGLTYGFGWSPYCNYYTPFYSPYFYNNWGNPYYGNYYGDGNAVANYGRRPSRNSALVIPTKRLSSTNTEGGRIRTTTSEEYYVKPARRRLFDVDPMQRTENSNTRIRNTSQNNNSIPLFSAPRNNNSGGGSRPASTPSRGGGGGGGRSRGN